MKKSYVSVEFAIGCMPMCRECKLCIYMYMYVLYLECVMSKACLKALKDVKI